MTWSRFSGLSAGVSALGYACAANEVSLGGLLEVFAVGSDGQVYTAWQETEGAPGLWTGWQPLLELSPGASKEVPTVVAGEVLGELWVVVLGSDGNLWGANQSAIEPGAWTTWGNLGAPSSSIGPKVVFSTAAISGQSLGAIWTMGYNDGQLWSIWPDPTGTYGWSDWISVGAPGERLYSPSSFALGTDTQGQLHCLAIGKDGSVWDCPVQLARAPASGFGTWSQLTLGPGSEAPTIVVGAAEYFNFGAVATNVDGVGNLELYLVDDAGTLWGIGQTAQVSAPAVPAWSSWVSLDAPPAGLAASPTGLATSRDLHGTELLAAIDRTGQPWAIASTIGEPPGPGNGGLLAPWSEWSTLGTDDLTDIQAAVNIDGSIELFALSDGQLCHTWETTPDSDKFITNVAIVLGGGGTACDFEVGALTYLADDQGISAGIACGTSMGALNAAKFAEGNLNALKAFWLGLMWPDDILTEEPWFQPTIGGGPHGNAWLVDAIEQGHVEPVTFPTGSAIAGAISAVGGGAGVANNVIKGIMSGYPTGCFSTALSTASQALGVVSAALGVVSFLIQLQNLLMPGDNQINDIANMFNEILGQNSFYNLDPLRQQLATSGLFGGIDPSAIADNNSQLLIGLSGVDDGGQYFVASEPGAAGLLVPFGSTASYSGPVDLIDTCIASIAQPLFSPPIPLAVVGTSDATEEFFDGSLLDSVPIDLAVAHDARTILVVVPVAPVPAELTANFLVDTNPTDYGGIFGVQSRANDITAHAIQSYSDQIDPSMVTVIQPSFTVHNPWAVDPGVISIAMAYGYMRAGEVMSGNEALKPFSDQITALRFEIWAAENQAMAFEYALAGAGKFGRRAAGGGQLTVTDDATQIPRIRDLKDQLRGLVCQYLSAGGTLPAADFRSNAELAALASQVAPFTSPFDTTDYRAWWIQWERHPYAPPSPSLTPWHSFDDGNWDCPPTPVSLVAAMLDPCAKVDLPAVPLPP